MQSSSSSHLFAPVVFSCQVESAAECTSLAAAMKSLEEEVQAQVTARWDAERRAEGAQDMLDGLQREQVRKREGWGGSEAETVETGYRVEFWTGV